MSRYNFFIHPSNLQKMDAVLKMRMTEGSAGYGIYIMLLELLRDSDDLKTAYDPAVIAWALHESDVDRLRRVCEEYDLFDISEKREISCPWLTEIMAEHTERRQKLSEAGKKSADLRKQRANHAETTLNNMVGGTSNKVTTSAQQTTIDKNTEEKEQIQPMKGILVGEMDVFSEECIKSIGRMWDPPFIMPDSKLKEWTDDIHKPAIIAEVVRTFKMSYYQFEGLFYATQKANIQSREMQELIRRNDHCKKTLFCPKHPYEYFIQKISKAHTEAEEARAESARSEVLHKQYLAQKANAVPMPEYIAKKYK